MQRDQIEAAIRIQHRAYDIIATVRPVFDGEPVELRDLANTVNDISDVILRETRILLDDVDPCWIPSEDETGDGSNTYKCSACGETQMLIDGTPEDNGWIFCPHCGERLIREDEL